MCTLNEPAAPASTAQALAMVSAGLGYLAGCDAADLGAAAQAEALVGLEQAEARATAARARILAAFSSQGGYQGDGQYGPTAPPPPPAPTDASCTATGHLATWHDLTRWLRSGSFGYALLLAGRVVGQTWAVIATVPAAVEKLLTADVAREIARAYGDRPIYPEQIVIDRPGQDRRRFPGWPEPVLVLADENQGACSWGVPLDGGPDGSQVLVGSDRTTVTYTGSVEDFIAARRWDYECVNAAFCVSAQASALDEASLGYLQGCCVPSVTTHGWPGMRQYRFGDQQVRVLLWSDTDQCDWLVSATAEEALTEFTARLLRLSSLRAAQWADEA